MLSITFQTGPLTLILKAAENVPVCITAGTGFVGVRCPAHPVTRQLLSLAGIPVAAPSANRFGHVRYFMALLFFPVLRLFRVVGYIFRALCCTRTAFFVSDLRRNVTYVLRIVLRTVTKMVELPEYDFGVQFLRDRPLFLSNGCNVAIVWCGSKYDSLENARNTSSILGH